MYRQYQTLIREYLGYFPCVVLIGARQSGKSTLIQMLDDGREIFDLESRTDYDQVARDPDLFLRMKGDSTIAIDEAQRLPELFPALRVAIDKDRNARGKYLLSGSSSPELLDDISESLAGRVGVIEIAPLSFSETGESKNPNLLKLFDENYGIDSLMKLPPTKRARADDALGKYWLRGGYPEPWIRNQQKFSEVWLEQYLQTYVERDIARLFPKLNPIRFRKFVEILAGYSGAIINYSSIANMLDITLPQVKDYFRIAHGTFIWRTIPAFTKNVGKRIVKHPKGYLRDSGMLHHILHIPSLRRLNTHPQMGASWEGVVIEEFIRTLNAAGVPHSAFYYRTAAGAEVDLVLEGKFGLLAFEIKHGDSVRRLRALRDFVNAHNCRFGVVVSRDEKVRQLDEKIISVPFQVLTDAVDG